MSARWRSNSARRCSGTLVWADAADEKAMADAAAIKVFFMGICLPDQRARRRVDGSAL
ncbi:hypothetical protein MGWOODY_Smn2185 [hydrothermal vent metagenome]|uniref:Uncharacterized protein n=1 Tax=hydrothermal vent metagenome TaxID=652676 RepID=A0A160TJU8_9ZZZZ